MKFDNLLDSLPPSKDLWKWGWRIFTGVIALVIAFYSIISSYEKRLNRAEMRADYAEESLREIKDVVKYIPNFRSDIEDLLTDHYNSMEELVRIKNEEVIKVINNKFSLMIQFRNEDTEILKHILGLQVEDQKKNIPIEREQIDSIRINVRRK